MPDRPGDEVILLQLVTPLGGDAPGDRIAVATSIGRALIAAGVARPAGDEAAARRFLRLRPGPPDGRPA